MESSRPAVFLQGNSSLDLARLPNLITIAADVLAGYWIANGILIDSCLFWLLLAASAAYGAGCALSDFCDREVDFTGTSRIPRETAEPGKSLVYCFSLFTVALGASFIAGGSAPLLIVLMILAAVLYNTQTIESAFLGPLNIAAYRALNLILGMGLPFWLGFHSLPSRYFPVFSFLYVFLFSWLSRSQPGGRSPERTAVVFLGWMHFLVILFYLSFVEGMNLGNLPFLVLLLVFTGPALLNAGRIETASAAAGALKNMVLGLPLLNAVYCSGVHGFAAGVPVALCTAAASILAMSKTVSSDLTRRSGWGKESF